MDQDTIELLLEENARMKQDFLRLSKEKAKIMKAAYLAHDAIVAHLSDADERLPSALFTLREAGIGNAQSPVCAFCGEKLVEKFNGETNYELVCKNEACAMFGKVWSDDETLPPWAI